jgi:hypothetical protein
VLEIYEAYQEYLPGSTEFENQTTIVKPTSTMMQIGKDSALR